MISAKEVKKLLDRISTHSTAICYSISDSESGNRRRIIEKIKSENDQIQDILVSFHSLYLQNPPEHWDDTTDS